MKLYGDDVFRTGASHQFLSYCGTAWATDELWCVCVAQWERDKDEARGAGRDGTEHCRDLQLTAAGSRSQDEETEEGETRCCALFDS